MEEKETLQSFHGYCIGGINLIDEELGTIMNATITAPTNHGWQRVLKVQGFQPIEVYGDHNQISVEFGASYCSLLIAVNNIGNILLLHKPLDDKGENMQRQIVDLQNYFLHADSFLGNNYDLILGRTDPNSMFEGGPELVRQRIRQSARPSTLIYDYSSGSQLALSLGLTHTSSVICIPWILTLSNKSLIVFADKEPDDLINLVRQKFKSKVG